MYVRCWGLRKGKLSIIYVSYTTVKLNFLEAKLLYNSCYKSVLNAMEEIRFFCWLLLKIDSKDFYFTYAHFLSDYHALTLNIYSLFFRGFVIVYYLSFFFCCPSVCLYVRVLHVSLSIP